MLDKKSRQSVLLYSSCGPCGGQKRAGPILFTFIPQAFRRNSPALCSPEGDSLCHIAARRAAGGFLRKNRRPAPEPTKGALEWGKLLGWWVGSRRVLEDAAAIICVGKDEYEEMKKAFPRKDVVYLPNGVDVARFAPGSQTDIDGSRQVSDCRTRFRKARNIPEDRFVFLVTARFDVQKNQLGLVQQLGNIISRIPDAHLLLVGAVTSPRYLETVRQAAASAGIADRITIIPGIPYTDQSLVDAYHAADSFILPSLHEPFGMVVLEAWAAGLPAAVSRRGGLPSIVTHHETGLLFDPEVPYDHPDSIASALIELRSDAEKRKRLADAGRKSAAETYSWDAVTDQLIEIYRRAYAHTLS